MKLLFININKVMKVKRLERKIKLNIIFCIETTIKIFNFTKK